jgi:hypothetical protein
MPFTLEPGEEKEICVLLDNPGDAFTGIQFDLFLPDGISVPTDADGYYCIDLGSRTSSRKHVLPECTMKTDSTLRVLCYSNSNATFTGENGDVLVITVVGDENLTGGVYDLKINNIVLSRPDVTNNKPADYKASILTDAGRDVKTFVLNGIYSADVLSEFSASLAYNTKITCIDLTQSIEVDETGTLTTGNPNTVLYLADGMSLANTYNVVSGDERSNIVLTDGYDFAIPENEECTNITYTRTFNNTEWQALYVPFEIPVDADFIAHFDVAYFNDVHSYDDNKDAIIDRMTMELIEIEEGHTLKANYPYLIRAKETGETIIAVTDATLYTTEENSINCTSVFMQFEVTGTYTTMTSEQLQGCYAVSNGKWAQSSGSAVLRPFRLWLKLTPIDGSPVKINEKAMRSISIRLSGEDDTTEIKNVKMGSQTQDFIYDIQGHRVENPTKGIYIMNGKKVYIENR